MRNDPIRITDRLHDCKRMISLLTTRKVSMELSKPVERSIPRTTAVTVTFQNSLIIMIPKRGDFFNSSSTSKFVTTRSIFKVDSLKSKHCSIESTFHTIYRSLGTDPRRVWKSRIHAAYMTSTTCVSAFHPGRSFSTSGYPIQYKLIISGS